MIIDIFLHIINLLLSSSNTSITVGQLILSQLSLFAIKILLQALNLSISSSFSFILNLSLFHLINNKSLNFTLSTCDNTLQISSLFCSFTCSISSFYLFLCLKEQTILRIQVFHNILLPFLIGRSRESLDNILKLSIICSLCGIKVSNYVLIASLIIVIISFSLLDTCHQIINFF